MVSSTNSALAMALTDFFDRNDIFDLPWVLVRFARTSILPLSIAIIAFGGSIKVLDRILKYLIPPPPRVHHDAAMTLYRRGFVQEALTAWSQLEPYGPSYMCRACHEIYVAGGDPKVGIEILEQAQQTQGMLKRNKKEMESMKEDARAMLLGNAVMVDMNARLAKQEYLGLQTPI
jgi:hypothetical protein